jgi:hypothetical protein
MSLTQMINTRKGVGVDLPTCICRRRAVANPEPEINPPNLLPAWSEAFFVAQIQLMQQMFNTMEDMQAQLHNN